MVPLILIAVGGAVGSVMRYACASAVNRMGWGALPWGTLAVNVLGGLAAGFIVHVCAVSGAWQKDLRALLVTGLLGGFTTFSAFSIEVFGQIERGAVEMALLYVALSVVGAVGGVACGIYAGRYLL